MLSLYILPIYLVDNTTMPSICTAPKSIYRLPYYIRVILYNKIKINNSMDMDLELLLGIYNLKQSSSRRGRPRCWYGKW